MAGNAVLIRKADVSANSVCDAGEEGDDELSSLHIQPKGGDFIAAADDAGDIHLLELCVERLASASLNATLSGDAPGATEAKSTPYEVKRVGVLRGGHSSVVTSAQFHPTMTRCLVSAALDASIAVWDHSKHTPLGSKNKGVSRGLEWSESMGGSYSARSFNPPLVHALAMHSGGRYFAAGLGDASVSLHAFASHGKKKGGERGPELVRRFAGGHSAAVAAVHFAAHDQDLLLSAGNDKRVAFWRLEPWIQKHEATRAHHAHKDNRGSGGKQKNSKAVVAESSTGTCVADGVAELSTKAGAMGVENEETEPHARLAHTEKVNWISSAHHTSVVFIADVSSVVSVFDVSCV
jgi:WD40 repeat protein